MLRFNHPDWVPMQTRQVGLEGTGEVALRQLVKESLRMRPSRIVGGEIRGCESSAASPPRGSSSERVRASSRRNVDSVAQQPPQIATSDLTRHPQRLDDTVPDRIGQPHLSRSRQSPKRPVAR